MNEKTRDTILRTCELTLPTLDDKQLTKVWSLVADLIFEREVDRRVRITSRDK